MTKQDEIKQILIDCIYTADAKPRFINDNWIGGSVNDKLKRIDEAVDKILKAVDEQSPEDMAYEILCCDDVYSIKEMIEVIQDQDTIDGSMLIDYVEGVQVWQKLELEYTCHEFLQHIGLKS